jgi:hypothetical protein
LAGVLAQLREGRKGTIQTCLIGILLIIENEEFGVFEDLRRASLKIIFIFETIFVA